MPNHKRWTEDKLAVVKELASAQGLTAHAIFELQKPELAQFTERAIQNTMARFGFTDPERSAQRKRARRLNQEEKDRLVAYLEGSGAKKSNTAVAKKLNVPLASVEYRRKKLGQRVDRIKIYKSAAYRRKASQRVLRYGEELRIARRAQFQARRQRLIKELRKRPDKVCLTCREPWFANEFFFYRASKRTKEGNVLLFATCKACVSEQRAKRHHRGF